jgi:hypothetical protein
MLPRGARPTGLPVRMLPGVLLSRKQSVLLPKNTGHNNLPSRSPTILLLRQIDPAALIDQAAYYEYEV